MDSRQNKSTFLGEFIQVDQLMSSFVQQNSQNESFERMTQSPLVLYIASQDSIVMSDGTHSIETRLAENEKNIRAQAIQLAKRVNGNGNRSALLGTFFMVDSYIFETVLVGKALSVQIILTVFSIKYIGNYGTGSLPLLKSSSNQIYTAGCRPPFLESDLRLKRALENIRRKHFADLNFFEPPLSLNQINNSFGNKGLVVDSSGFMVTPRTITTNSKAVLSLDDFKAKPRTKKGPDDKNIKDRFDTKVFLFPSKTEKGEEDVLLFTSSLKHSAIELRKTRRTYGLKPQEEAHNF